MSEDRIDVGGDQEIADARINALLGELQAQRDDMASRSARHAAEAAVLGLQIGRLKASLVAFEAVAGQAARAAELAEALDRERHNVACRGAERDEAMRERDAAAAMFETLKAERDDALAERDAAIAERDELQERMAPARKRMPPALRGAE